MIVNNTLNVKEILKIYLIEQKIYPNHQDEWYAYHSDLSCHVSECTVHVCSLLNLYIFLDTRHTCTSMLIGTSYNVYWAGTAYPSGTPDHVFTPGFFVGFALLDLQFSVHYFVNQCLYLFFWLLYCLSLHLRLLIAPLIWYLQSFH